MIQQSIVSEKLIKIKGEFENRVKECIEHYKRVKCNYDPMRKSDVPWDCKICTCIKSGDTKGWGACKNLPKSRAIYAEYLEYLATGLEYMGRTIEFTVKPEITIKQDEFNEHIICGDKEKSTIKFTADGHALLLHKPRNINLYTKGDLLNPKLWAKKLYTTDKAPYKFEISEEIDENFKSGTKKFMLVDDYYKSNIRNQEIVPVIWKDSWYDEFKDIRVTEDDPYGGSLTKDVCPPEWGDTDFLREWVSNAFDVTPQNKDIDLYIDDHNNLVLEYDSSSPLLPKYLCLMGKREEHKGSIGKFGEGIKQATAGFSRENYLMKIETIGYTYYPVFKYDGNFTKEYTLHYWWEPNDKKEGTKVTIMNIPSPQNLINETKKLFLRWREIETLYDDGEGNQILGKWVGDPPKSSCVSVRGVRTELIKGYGDNPPLLFNYNFYNNDLMNRDRKFVGAIHHETKNLFKKLGPYQKDLIQQICFAYEDTHGKYDDLQIDWGDKEDEITKHLDYPDTWKEAVEHVINKKYGNYRVAITSKIDWKDKNLQDLGYMIVDWGEGNRLLHHLGYKYVDDFPQSIGKPKILPIADLTSDETLVFKQAKENLRKLMKEYYKLKDDYIKETLDNLFIASSFEGVKEAEDAKRWSTAKIWGLCQNCRSWMEDKDKKIYILRDALTHKGEMDTPINKSTGILIHEFIHKKTGYGDEKREFENVLTDLLGYTGSEWERIRKAMDEEYESYWIPESIVIEYKGKPTEWEYPQAIIVEE